MGQRGVTFSFFRFDARGAATVTGTSTRFGAGSMGPGADASTTSGSSTDAVRVRRSSRCAVSAFSCARRPSKRWLMNSARASCRHMNDDTAFFSSFAKSAALG